MTVTLPISPEQLPLRDIHLPAETLTATSPPNGPVAMLLLAGLLMVAALLGLWMALRRRRRATHAHALLAQIERQRARAPTDPAWLIALSELLRRTALARYPREAVAGLTGRAWLAFLDSHGGGSAFSAAAGQWLLEGPYRAQVALPDAQAVALLDAARRWLDAKPPGASC